MSHRQLDPLNWLDEELAQLERATLRRRLVVRDGPQAAVVRIDGRELVNFGSNDYLGLAADPRLADAAKEAIRRHGWGSASSPLVSGRSGSHSELERRLAEFFQSEAALVFPSGFAANAGVVPALVDEGDAIYSDAANHASLIDGCRLSRAARFIYPHCDCKALEQQLRGSDRFRKRLILSNSLFSMTGEIGPLVELADLAERYNAMLMVDEAHAVGVFGEHGRGVVEHLAAKCPGLERRIPIRIGALSKALASGGGFVCGSQSLVDWLCNRVRSYVFSTAQPAATSAAALAALDVVQQEPHRRRELLDRASHLRTRLNEHGWNTGPSQSQIVPIIIGEADETMRFAAGLREAGFFVPGIRPPTVPPGQSLLRLTLCYHHTPPMIDRLFETLQRLR